MKAKRYWLNIILTRLLSLLPSAPLRYTGIDNLPVGVWDQIHNTGNVLLLLKNPKSKRANIHKLVDQWEKIVDEYLTEFGLPEEKQVKMRHENQAAINRANYILTGKKHYLTHAKIEDELANGTFENTNKGFTLGKTLSLLSKYYQFKIDEKKTTVRQYFDYVETAKKASNG